MKENEIKQIGDEEKERWESTYSAIVSELRRSREDFKEDQKLARELNSQIVASTRDEDKIALANDEAVAYGLSKVRKNKSNELEQLLDQPYFARVITEEDGKTIEFKLGTASFPSQRIIDWRKAPISKLYYDYAEGEDFSEFIQGRDREGIILLRRSYQGKERELKVIETAKGTIYWHEGSWHHDPSSLVMSRKAGQDGHLPPILSLITPDQFNLITHDADKPMIIQGVAGSGKTTVALHRLAWLLHEDNSDIKPEKAMVVMLNRSLKNYVELTLPELNIEGVHLKTYNQWLLAVLKSVGERRRGQEAPNPQVDLFKTSQQALDLMEEYVSQGTGHRDFKEDYFNFLKFLKTKTITKFADHVVKARTNHQIEHRYFDGADDTLLVHLIFYRNGYLPQTAEGISVLDHIVIDECQDFGITEIKALLLSLNTDRTITLVGDRAQKIVEGRDFNDWGELLASIGMPNVKPVELNISYRTTEEIMEVARAIRNDPQPIEVVTKRHGPAPRLILAEGPEVLPNYVSQWVTERLKESTHSLSAIICRTPKDAQMLCDTLRKMGYASVRLGYRDQFTFAPGIVVTNVNQVKGLEFRNVLIIEATEKNYRSNNQEDRNLLYVAVTRAEVLLDFIASGPLSPILPDIEIEEKQPEYIPSQFVDEETPRDSDINEPNE